MMLHWWGFDAWCQMKIDWLSSVDGILTKSSQRTVRDPTGSEWTETVLPGDLILVVWAAEEVADRSIDGAVLEIIEFIHQSHKTGCRMQCRIVMTAGWFSYIFPITWGNYLLTGVELRTGCYWRRAVLIAKHCPLNTLTVHDVYRRHPHHALLVNSLLVVNFCSKSLLSRYQKKLNLTKYTVSGLRWWTTCTPAISLTLNSIGIRRHDTSGSFCAGIEYNVYRCLFNLC